MPVPAGFVANQSGYYTRGDGAGPFSFDGTTMSFSGDGPVATYSSGNVANAAAVGTIPAVAGKIGYITGFDVSGTGSTGAGAQLLTITGLLGGTATYTVAVPAGPTVQLTPITYSFVPPLIASAENTAIVVTLPALGGGNIRACVSVHGYSL